MPEKPEKRLLRDISRLFAISEYAVRKSEHAPFVERYQLLESTKVAGLRTGEQIITGRRRIGLNHRYCQLLALHFISNNCGGGENVEGKIAGALMYRAAIVRESVCNLRRGFEDFFGQGLPAPCETNATIGTDQVHRPAHDETRGAIQFGDVLPFIDE